VTGEVELVFRKRKTKITLVSMSGMQMIETCEGLGLRWSTLNSWEEDKGDFISNAINNKRYG